MKLFQSSIEVFIIFVLFCASGVHADPFIGLPGTRAKAMGGAFCGIADDASAVWYNPAGTAAGDYEFVFEWSQAISKDTKNKGDDYDLSLYGVNPTALTNDENNSFMAIKGLEKDIEQNVLGYVFYYLSPYTIDWYFPPENKKSKTFGNFREKMSIIGIATAVSSYNNHLMFGITIEYLLMRFEIDDIYIFDDINNYSKISINDNHSHGFSGSFGFLGVLFDNKEHAIRAKVGGVYRLGSTCNAFPFTESDTEIVTKQMVFSKPSSFDLGFSFSKSFTSLRSAFLFAGQIGETDWSQTNDIIKNKYKKTSIGAEWQIAFENKLRLAFRCGTYSSDADKPEQGWPDVKGTTFGIGALLSEKWGIGALFAEKWGLDCTYENRDFSLRNSGFTSQNISLISLSLTFTF